MTITKLVTVQAAYDDFLQRSLSKLSCDLARLIYLASTRDYNTGTYHHDGLASRFSPEVAAKALEIAHRQIFFQLSAYSLEELVEQLRIYFDSSRDGAAEISAHVAEARAVSDRNSCGSKSRGGAVISVERQTRFGNLAVPSGAVSAGSLSRIATAVTWPIISASDP